ncbi:MAG: hypothetical protein ACFCU3_05510 [Verrucomicrobiales bacterium]
MTLLVAALCDAATDYHGKLNILGAFDTIFSQNFPAVHPHCCLALRMLFAKDEEGTRQLEVNLINADGQGMIPPVKIPVRVVVPDEVDAASQNVVINMQQLRFLEPGQYAFDITLDAIHRISIPLRVVSVAPPAEQETPF